MNELHDRINKVINTLAFEVSLEKHGLDLIEFQSSWCKLSQGKFENLPQAYQDAICAGERELQSEGEFALA